MGSQDHSAEPDAVLAELLRREPLFHRPEFGSSRSDFENMITSDFWEIGASGRRYGREYVLDALDERHLHPQPDPWEVRDPACQRLAERVYLMTYTLLQGDRISRRATLWLYSNAGWKAAYHQGTLVQDSEP